VEKAYRSLGGRVEFIGIISDDREKTAEYMKKHGPSLPVAYDGDKKVSSSFGAKVPANIIIDAGGTVIYREASPPDDIEAYLHNLLGSHIE